MLVPFFSLSLTILLALLLDRLLGEPKKYHYLVAFGTLCQRLEKKLNPEYKANFFKKNQSANVKNVFSVKSATLGALAWGLLVLPLPLIYWFLFRNISWQQHVFIDSIILYLAIGLSSLKQHAMQVYRPLKSGDLETARKFTGYLVSRETQSLSTDEMSRATVESVLENGHDAVIASLLFYLIGGAPLVIIHRLANTLDAMWGYKNPRYFSFGYASARLDDLLGFLTAKCCTLLYAVQGNFLVSLKNAYSQGNRYKSHNGGWVMAAGATVMNVSLGGSANYHGTKVNSIKLGSGGTVTIDDIPQSLALVQRAAILLLLFIFALQLFMYVHYFSMINGVY
ncbi:cobalamin biosynthesis protein CobD/CbiB [Thalassotalea piscium]